MLLPGLNTVCLILFDPFLDNVYDNLISPSFAATQQSGSPNHLFLSQKPEVLPSRFMSVGEPD